MLQLDAQGYPKTPLLMYMSSTRKAVSMRWNTQIQLKMDEYNAPRHGLVWKFVKTTETNNKGTWYGFNIEFAGKVTDEGLFEEATKYRQSLGQPSALQLEQQPS